MRLVAALVAFLLIASLYRANAQQNDFSVLKHICAQISKTDPLPETSAHKKMILPTRLLFGFYRHVVSEQISADCAFDMTCSRFSIAAIRHFGIIKGGLLTADRLTRCHVLVAQETVPIHFNMHSGKVIDEPEMY